MIPRISPNYGWCEVLNCFLPAASNSISLLENLIATEAKHKYGVSFRYGRMGLYYLLKAMGAQNKKVILPSYTCVVMGHAIVLSGNIPIYLDNKRGTFQPSPDEYLEVIDSETVMVIPTHLFGVCQEVEHLYHKIKKDYPHVFVLQDCAHSFFCKTRKGEVVTRYGDGALFGMNISKLINSRQGGMLTLNDQELAGKVRTLATNQGKEIPLLSSLGARIYVLLASFAFSRLIFKSVHLILSHTNLLKSHTDYYDPSKIDLPSNCAIPLTPFEAKIGIQSFEKFPKRIQERKRIAEFYCQSLSSIPEISLPTYSPGNTWSHFPVFVPAQLRNNLKNALEKTFSAEIGTIVDYSVADLEAYRRLNDNSCPNAVHAGQSVINLPLSFREGLFPISRKKQEKEMVKIIKTIKAFF